MKSIRTLQCTVLQGGDKSSISKMSFWYLSAPIWLRINHCKNMVFHQLWPNNPNAPGPTTSGLNSGGFIEVNNCLIWCSTAYKVAGCTFVPPLLNWSTVQWFFRTEPHGSNWMFYFAGSSKSLQRILDSLIFFEIHLLYIDMKTSVKCWKYFLLYSKRVETYCETNTACSCVVCSVRKSVLLSARNRVDTAVCISLPNNLERTLLSVLTWYGRVLYI